MAGAAQNLKEMMWRRHRNPWSGWTRVALMPPLAIALWYHHWVALALCIIAIVTNPFWFGPPQSDGAWMTRAVDGEKIWLARADWLEKAVLLGPSVVFSFILIWALYVHDPVWTTISAVTAIGHKFLFLFYCVRIADQNPRDHA